MSSPNGAVREDAERGVVRPARCAIHVEDPTDCLDPIIGESQLCFARGLLIVEGTRDLDSSHRALEVNELLLLPSIYAPTIFKLS